MIRMSSRPRFLLSNDDGFRAPGIQELARRLMSIGEVVVVAPDGPRSGFSSAISTTLPLRPKLRHQEEGLTIYSIEGTPADCVKLALGAMLVDAMPDLVVSGINHGSNDGVCVHYSGTIGAAREACIASVPALAVSLDDVAECPDFDDALDYTERVVKFMLGNLPHRGTLYSLNIPKEKPLGLKVCPQAVSRFVNEWMPSRNARGQQIYWMTGSQRLPEGGVGDTDVELLRAGYATLTPLMLDQTDYKALETLAGLSRGI